MTPHHEAWNSVTPLTSIQENFHAVEKPGKKKSLRKRYSSRKAHYQKNPFWLTFILPEDEQKYRRWLLEGYRQALIWVALGIVASFVFHIVDWWQICSRDSLRDCVAHQGPTGLPAFPVALAGLTLTIVIAAIGNRVIFFELVLALLLMLISICYLLVTNAYAMPLALFALLSFNRQVLLTHATLFFFSCVYWVVGVIAIVLSGSVTVKHAVGASENVIAGPIVLLTFSVLIIVRSSFYAETRLRRMFAMSMYMLKVDSERKVLRNEVFVGAMEKFNVPIFHVEQFDMDSPAEKVMAILHKLVDPNLYDLEKDVFDSLKEIIVYLSKSHDMFKPELQDAIDKNQLVLDKETKRYVVNMLASKTERDRKSIVARSHTEKLRLHGKSNQLPDDLPGIVSAPDKLAALANGMEEWEYDLFDVVKETQGKPIQFLGAALFQKYGLIEHFKIDPQILTNFLRAAEKGYQAMPYHNCTHGADVTRTVHYFLHASAVGDLCSAEELLAIIVASIMHDYDHPGRSNAFHVAIGHDRALLYNDISVLENHHVASLSFLLKKKDCDIFASLSRNCRMQVRKQIIDLVLVTDLAKHFSFVGEFKTKQAAGTLTLENPECRTQILQMTLKCGDLGHAAKPLNLHTSWTMRVNEEFYAQGDDERKAGLQISPFMDREKADLPRSQLGFMNFLVMPMYEEFLKLVDPENKFPCIENLTKNRNHWKSLIRDDAPPENS
eukprot:CAMPEP_0175139788 /NCGR_PEP_ID=MMETSP0087-20121206/11108_1 /TAXON_ID=136419 /ORGANISM="Unknown Unknown, Strain D1" /LENGTH=722 /DNA_ID=CAMNT_0016422859 /DNA_START=77 /DNA_END=2245 /DNA_ORIENTATION=+